MSTGEGTTAGNGAAAIEVEPDRVAGWLQEDPGPQLIDVREDYEREAGHIAGSRHIALNTLSSEAASLEHERPVVLYCRVGARSDMAAQALRTAGFDAYSMNGGLMRWAREGRPLVPDGGTVADH
jgi:rhodanese-related sulfurtransferase